MHVSIIFVCTCTCMCVDAWLILYVFAQCVHVRIPLAEAQCMVLSSFFLFPLSLSIPLSLCLSPSPPPLSLSLPPSPPPLYRARGPRWWVSWWVGRGCWFPRCSCGCSWSSLWSAGRKRQSTGTVFQSYNNYSKVTLFLNWSAISGVHEDMEIFINGSRQCM